MTGRTPVTIVCAECDLMGYFIGTLDEAVCVECGRTLNPRVDFDLEDGESLTLVFGHLGNFAPVVHYWPATN